MKANKKGYRVIGLGVLLLLLVGMIGVGWYVWQSRDQSDSTPDVSQNEEATPVDETGADTSSGYLVLADFKVRIPLDSRTSRLSLGPVSDSIYDETGKMIPITAPELDDAWVCEEDESNGIKGTIGSISITDQEGRFGPYEPLATKEIGSYTYGFEAGGSNCTDSSLYDQLVDAFKIQFDKMEAY